MQMVINSTELKTKGLPLIDSVVQENDSAIIAEEGNPKYIVLKLSDYNRMREQELEAALQESMADIAAGRYHTDGVEAHMNRVGNV